MLASQLGPKMKRQDSLITSRRVFASCVIVFVVGASLLLLSNIDFNKADGISGVQDGTQQLAKPESPAAPYVSVDTIQKNLGDQLLASDGFELTVVENDRADLPAAAGTLDQKIDREAEWLLPLEERSKQALGLELKESGKEKEEKVKKEKETKKKTKPRKSALPEDSDGSLTSDEASDDDEDGSKRSAGEVDPVAWAAEDRVEPGDTLPICDEDMSEIIPCLDHRIHKRMKLKLTTALMEHYERHCPDSRFRLGCLVPPPPNYQSPIPWPASRDEVWTANVPHTFLAREKSDQHWMVVDGDRIRFPGGGTHFHDGADKYIQALAKMLGSRRGDISLGGRIRTALDIGCGVASFGAFLLPHNVLTLSMAPNDVHQNQIQFALERGLPAWLGVMGTQRLPMPARAFDLAHCSRCRIDWAQRGGLLLLELDRLLRPGGLWVWSAPPAYREDEESQAAWREVTGITDRLCWRVIAQGGQTAIFQKPLNGRCYRARPEGAQPELCPAGSSADEAWYTPLGTCIAAPASDAWRELPQWPERLRAPPAALQQLQMDARQFQAQEAAWQQRVASYFASLREHLDDASLRNVMDMSAGVGAFAAAMEARSAPVWVMNAVPPGSTHQLQAIYERGLLGVYHDWCEEFSTYPRTYDLLHGAGVLSTAMRAGCPLKPLLLEMDRILRPAGFLVLRDQPVLLQAVRERAEALLWTAVEGPKAVERDAASQEGEEEAVLILRKDFWTLERE